MNHISSAQRPALRLVRGTAPERAVLYAWFCGYCAAGSPGGPASPHARVCGACGLGLLLETRDDLVPAPRDAFVVVDARLTVQGVSRRAEGLLGLCEDAGIDRPLRELLVPADAEATRPEALDALVVRAASGEEILTTHLRPRNTFGVRLKARVGSCGPPRAALLVFPSQHSPLRAL
jgi:hypothetical protein